MSSDRVSPGWRCKETKATTTVAQRRKEEQVGITREA
jgi:hypothetical protein